MVVHVVPIIHFLLHKTTSGPFTCYAIAAPQVVQHCCCAGESIERLLLCPRGDSIQHVDEVVMEGVVGETYREAEVHPVLHTPEGSLGEAGEHGGVFKDTSGRHDTWGERGVKRREDADHEGERGREGGRERERERETNIDM